MKIEWIEKHSIEIDDEVFKEIANDQKHYGKGWDGDLLEDCMADWLYEVDRTNVYNYVENWDGLVQKLRNEVNKYVTP